jgi:hypothetical protein
MAKHDSGVGVSGADESAISGSGSSGPGAIRGLSEWVCGDVRDLPVEWTARFIIYTFILFTGLSCGYCTSIKEKH